MVHVIDLTASGNPVTSMTQAFVETVDRPDREQKRFGVYYLAAESEFAPLARLVEREVFEAYFDNDALVMDAEYGPYEENSTFVLAVDHQLLEPVGVVRRIHPGAPGLKTLRDLEEIEEWNVSESDIAEHHPGFRADRCVDFATLAVRRAWTQTEAATQVAAAIEHATFRVDTVLPIDHAIMVLDEVVAALVLAGDVPLRPVCDLPAIEYLGSPLTRPYLFSVDEASEVARTTAGPLGRMLAYGEGLDGISLPPLDLRDDVTASTFVDVEPQGRRIGTGVAGHLRRAWAPRSPAST